MNDATRRQIEAAAPHRSTWLSANAGSGKTRVLTDRVARLLLDGVSPQNILCLTYTKAAASEMQNRLFKRLGEWAMLPDDALRDNLTALGVDRTERLRQARRLFAQSVEAPGGLRIQTIHSFCAILLRRFPVEARVSPQFTEMDDRSAQMLRDDCLEDLAEDNPALMAAMARTLGGADMRGLVEALVGARDAFRVPLNDDDLRALLDLAPGDSLDGLLADVFRPGDDDMLDRVADRMAEIGTATDKGNADRLRSAGAGDLSSLSTLEGLLLYGASAKDPFGPKIGKFPGSAAQKALAPEDADALGELMTRVAEARLRRLALVEFTRNATLQRFAADYLPCYARAKEARGWLDFDDLILKARDLLTAPEVADWVLYRLDGGIEHILVDEAQDTSPAQWQMIRALSSEVAAGEGTRAAGERTIFVVGDKKQSIYSFQGADPEGFDRMYEEFSERLGGAVLQRLDMLHSFRSAPAVLRAVDATFDGQGMEHIAFRDALPGRVDLWPLVESTEEPEPLDFDDPVDRISARDARVQLAQALADGLREICDTATIPDGDGTRRRVHAGDVLILFRSRGALFHETIRACKARGLPVAGADQLILMAELAVRDVAALLSFLATPEDSLSLAASLRSPLLGWSEAELYGLAQGRRARDLWQELRDRRQDHPQTLAILDDLRGQADFLRPYDLIERILTRHGGRARLIGRLGPECEEAIDALLDQALVYERTDIPSLTGFLSWLTGDEIKVKRQAEGAGRNLRIMSIHGAKGLEAPIVVLPETMGRAPNIDAALWPVPGGGRMLKQVRAAQPDILRDAYDGLKQAQDEERDRLLYVAMTRAQFWLICCGHGDPSETDGRWYGQIAAGLDRLDATELATPVGPGRRYAHGDWTAADLPLAPEGEAPVLIADLPDWIDTAAPPPEPAPKALSPSGLGGAKALAGEIVPDTPEDDDEVLLRGSDLHSLLERLPPDRPADWPAMAARLLPHLDAEARARRLDDVGAVFGAPALRDLFARPALIEVPVAAQYRGRALTGAIDRLVLDGDRVLAIDYKSNRIVPDTPDAVPLGLLRQMGAYDAALSQIYPGKRIETALLWTSTATLMALPPDLVRRALNEAPLP